MLRRDRPLQLPSQSWTHLFNIPTAFQYYPNTAQWSIKPLRSTVKVSCQRRLRVNVMLRLHLFSEVTTARGDVMTSWESLYLEAIWATDDDDDAWAPEASRPHEGGQEAKIKKISEGIRGFNSESSAGLWTVSIICTNCYHTDPGLSGTTLSISSTAFISHSGATSGYTDSSEAINEKTISSNKVRRLFPKSSEKLDIKCNF